MIDIRIERPRSLDVIDGLLPHGLVAIDFNPPAAGPEIELTFAPPEPGPDAETFETFIRGAVEKLTGGSVLACRTRPADGVTITISDEGARSFISDSAGWGAIGLQEISEAIVAELGRRA